MELIRINDQKLKIMLTPLDMTHFEMNAERLGEDSEQMRRSFRMLMKEVRRKIAFELDDRRVSVQYFPSRGGGCEMFVSCSLKKEEKKKAPAAQNENNLPQKADSKSEVCWRETIYRMMELNNLLAACQRLNTLHFSGKSRVYKDETGSYFLFLTLPGSSPLSTPTELAFLSEYGDVCNPLQAKLYIGEHANLISEYAVEELSGLA